MLGNRRLTVCRELTKKYETAFRTDFQQAIQYYGTEEPNGECVLVIEGKKVEEVLEEKKRAWQEFSLEEHMELYEKQGISHKEAMRLVAKDRGVSRRDIYQELLEKNKN